MRGAENYSVWNLIWTFCHRAIFHVCFKNAATSVHFMAFPQPPPIVNSFMRAGWVLDDCYFHSLQAEAMLGASLPPGAINSPAFLLERFYSPASMIAHRVWPHFVALIYHGPETGKEMGAFAHWFGIFFTNSSLT